MADVTLWMSCEGRANHWCGRACKFYTLTRRGWKMIAQTGLLDYTDVRDSGEGQRQAAEPAR